MESLIGAIIDFIRVRQLNIAVAAILSGAYLIYQYWDILTKPPGEHECRHVRPSRSRSRSVARSRSRSRSSNYYKQTDSKHRRGRKSHRRCHDCSLCEFEQ